MCPISFGETKEKGFLYMPRGGANPISVPLDVPRFETVTLENGIVPDGDYSNSFLRIIKGSSDKDPTVPDCLWYKVVVEQEIRERRTRLEQSEINTVEAITKFLELENVPRAKIGKVLDLLQEIMNDTLGGK